MGFDTAFARLNGLGAAALAPLPGLLLGLLAFGLFLPLARALRAHGVAPGVGTVLGRTGSGRCPLLGGLAQRGGWPARGGEDRNRRPNGGSAGQAS